MDAFLMVSAKKARLDVVCHAVVEHMHTCTPLQDNGAFNLARTSLPN